MINTKAAKKNNIFSNPRAFMNSQSTIFKKQQRTGYLMLLPALLIVGGMYLYPAVLTVIFSISEVHRATFSITELVYLKHYIDLLSQPSFWTVVGRTLYFALMIVVLTVLLSLGIAFLLNQQFLGRTILRVVVLLPWAVPPVVSGVLWGQMFHAETGMMNALLYQFGIISENIIWMGNSVLALHVVILAEVWRAIPFLTLFILAGIQNINPALYEAASIDGANRWEKFKFIFLPSILPVLIPVIILQFSFAMKAFDTIFVLTRGSQGTSILNYFVYRETFEYLEFGLGAASAYILFILTIVFVFLLIWLQRRFIKGGTA